MPEAMIAGARRRLRRALTKNSAELRAFATGKMPSFVVRNSPSRRLRGIPVFTFHDVDPDAFEKQACFLAENGYETLTSDELASRVERHEASGKEIALTFDDGTWTFWTYVYPILRKYSLKATLFVIPAVVPDDSRTYPTIADLWQLRCGRDDLARRAETQPLCTWLELKTMHESGIVDIQSHSLTHQRVSVSGKLVDFLHPEFEAYVARLNVPVYSVDCAHSPERGLRLGAPVFENAPRLAGRLRFNESPQVLESTISYVAARGGRDFFERPSWRRELSAVFRRWPKSSLGAYETHRDMVAAIRRECGESRRALEDRLGKNVRHFCYPWFRGSPLADTIAVETGYRAVYGGPLLDTGLREGLLRVQRIGEEYLLRLPGKERTSLWSVWSSKIHRRGPAGTSLSAAD